MARWVDVNEKTQMTVDHGLDAEARGRIVRQLQELIAALDRRVPQMQRVGEVAIAEAAAALRAEALNRIHTIEAER